MPFLFPKANTKVQDQPHSEEKGTGNLARGSGADEKESSGDNEGIEEGAGPAGLMPMGHENSAGASEGYIGFVGADPVTGQLVRSGELTKATPAEVEECLKQYNELDGEEQNKERAAGGGGAAAVEGSTGRGQAASPSSGGGGGDKNSDARARDVVPVANAGPGTHHQSGVPTGG